MRKEDPAPPLSVGADRAPRYFDVVLAGFVAIFLISQVSSTKLVQIGPFQGPGAIILFPVSYIFGDILTEVYGFNRARRAIWTGFLSAVLMSAVLAAIQYMPPAPDWPLQRAYEQILGFVPRIVAGSIIAFWAGEFANSFVLAKMKLLTRGRHLWSRTIGSTVVGQFVDTGVFVAFAFWGTVPMAVLAQIIVSLYVTKVLYEVVATPLTYVAVNSLKRIEGIDIYDESTKFTPFKF